MKIDDALKKIEDIITEGDAHVDLEPDEKVASKAIRVVLDDLYQSGMVQGQRQLQDELRHLLGVVKE